MRGHGNSLTVLAVIVGTVISAGVGWQRYRHESRVIGTHVSANLQIWATSLERELDLSFEVLLAMKALGEVATNLERDGFRRFVAPFLERHPEVRALEWVPRVSAGDRESVEASARRAGFEGFRITERTEQGQLVRAGDRGAYYPVYFVEPLEGNEAALGFDLASDPARLSALDRARDSGTLQATAPIRLIQDSTGDRQFLVALPVHRDELPGPRGFMLAVFSVGAIVEQATRHATFDVAGLQFDLLDDVTNEQLYSLPFQADEQAAQAVEAAELSIEVAGRSWRLRATPSETYVASRRNGRPINAILVGIGLTLVVGSCLTVVHRRTRAVERIVESRTADLTRANASLDEQRRVLQSVLDNLGDGVAVADETGRLVLFNPAAERIFGLGQIDSGPDEWTRLYGLYHPDGKTPIALDELPLARAVAGEASSDVEMFVRNPKREGGLFIRVTATPIRESDGTLRGGVAVVHDITKSKWAETALRESEGRFRSIVDATGSALIILSPDHRILEFNPEAERIYGEKRTDVVGRDYFELFLPREYWSVVDADIDKTLKGRSVPDIEVPVRSEDGGNRVLLMRLGRLTGVDGRLIGIVATGHDITERREAEEAQRVRQLAAHLQSAREGERKHAAREIHDELGQVLTGLKFEFSHLARRLVDVEPDLREKTVLLERLIDSTIGSVRRIAAELRPHILDQLGLLEAVRWQAREFEKRTGIACSLDLTDDEIDWGQDRATAVFRILQESLTNVARHSGAAHVEVSIDRNDSQIVLEVRDDGRGIRDEELADAQSFGLMGMRERARMFGGVLTVKGVIDGGTTVRVRLPV
jgi:two-component system sensor histidine kinase UhpB